jgi:hypothetical protein
MKGSGERESLSSTCLSLPPVASMCADQSMQPIREVCPVSVRTCSVCCYMCGESHMASHVVNKCDVAVVQVST